ncbi:MAG: O-antigen ligase family protein [Maribacter sp.]
MVKINYTYQTLILLLLWVSGMFKPFVIAYVADFDIVLFALIIACLDIAFQLGTKFKKPAAEYVLAASVLLGFYFYLIFSNTYSVSSSYALVKTANFVPNLVFFCYALTLKKIDLKLFIWAYCLVLIPLAVFFIYMKSIVWQVDSSATRIFKDLRNYYLSIGLHLGMLSFLVYYYLKRIWLIAALLFLLVASSARAALFLTVLTFMIFEFQKVITFKVKKKILVLAVSTLVFLFAIGALFWDKLSDLLSNSLGRLAVLFSGSDKSSQGRLDAMAFALESSVDSLGTFFFGHGIGSFGMRYLGIDDRAYPHNLFIELLFELGCIGLVMILFVMILTFLRALKGAKLFLVLFFFCFMNAMKSSGLTDLWILFSIMGLTLNQKRIPLLK